MRLLTFYKIVNHLVELPVPSYIAPSTRYSRDKYIKPSATVDAYKFSFYPRSIILKNYFTKWFDDILQSTLTYLMTTITDLKTLFLYSNFEFLYYKFNDFFTSSQGNINLNCSRIKMSIWLFFNRILNHWNSLPDYVVNSNSVNSFKSLLDSHLVNFVHSNMIVIVLILCWAGIQAVPLPVITNTNIDVELTKNEYLLEFIIDCRGINEVHGELYSEKNHHGLNQLLHKYG